MNSDKFIVRLAVGVPEGAHSATIRVWNEPSKSDMYASVRQHGGRFKVSLHESGECNTGLTYEFAKQEANAVAAMGGIRHQSKWVRATQTGSKVVMPLQFVFPGSELRGWKDKSNQSEVNWISPPLLGNSVVVSCVFSGQELPDNLWPGKMNGVQFLSSKVLPNGEKFWLLWRECLSSEYDFLFAEARTHAGQTSMLRFAEGDNDSSPMSRVLIFKEFRKEQLLVVLDADAVSLAVVP